MEVLLDIKKAQKGDKQAFCRVIENICDNCFMCIHSETPCKTILIVYAKDNAVQTIGIM